MITLEYTCCLNYLPYDLKRNWYTAVILADGTSKVVTVNGASPYYLR